MTSAPTWQMGQVYQQVVPSQGFFGVEGLGDELGSQGCGQSRRLRVSLFAGHKWKGL